MGWGKTVTMILKMILTMILMMSLIMSLKMRVKILMPGWAHENPIMVAIPFCLGSGLGRQQWLPSAAACSPIDGSYCVLALQDIECFHIPDRYAVPAEERQLG